MKFILVIITCALIGCAGAPRKSDVTVPAHWSFDPAILASENAADAAVERGHSMWGRFHSAELTALLQSAAEHSFEYASAAAEVAQQQALARIARASLYPTLGVETSLSGQSSNSKSLGSVSGFFFDMGLGASYELDAWGKNRERVRAAEHSRDGSRLARDEAALRVAVSVASAYFQVLSFRERIQRGHTNQALLERVLSLVEARERAGAEQAREVAQQRALLASEQVRVEQLIVAEAQARIDLALASGSSLEAVPVQAGSLDGVDEPAFEQADFEAPERLLMKRPDIARAEAELAATHANVEAARKALLPQLRLTGQLAYQHAFRTRFTDQGSEYAYSADGAQLVYSGAFVMSQPLFDGGALAAERDAARARRLQAEVNYRRSVVQAISEVERALHELRGLREQVERQRSAVNEAHRAFELIEVEYRAGAEDLMAVLDAQRTLFRAEDEFSQLSAAKLHAAATLIAALGAGWSAEHSSAHLNTK